MSPEHAELCERLKRIANIAENTLCAEALAAITAISEKNERLREALDWALRQKPAPRLIRGQNDAYCAAYARARAALGEKQ